MAWEIEDEYVDLAEMHHRTIYVERSLKTRSGELVRHVDDVLLGTHGFSSTRGAGSSSFTLAADGTLTDAEGKEVNIGHRQTGMLASLNGIHLAGRAFAKKHNKRIGARKKK